MYRLLYHERINKECYQEFQSPNGVQIAFVTCLFATAFHAVSITKRCTDCFHLNSMVLFVKNVSITKRCTDCFITDCVPTSLIAFQSPNGVQIALVVLYLLRGISSPFQSPNGVQIAFMQTLRFPLALPSFNHQTVYRLL